MMKAVSTQDTLSPEISLPVRMCQGETVVVRSSSSVCRSRSLVTLPAEKTGPTSTLNSTM